MEITIIGAGMGGLTTGIALKKFGHKVTIYEQAEKIYRWARQSHFGQMG